MDSLKSTANSFKMLQKIYIHIHLYSTKNLFLRFIFGVFAFIMIVQIRADRQQIGREEGQDRESSLIWDLHSGRP